MACSGPLQNSIIQVLQIPGKAGRLVKKYKKKRSETCVWEGARKALSEGIEILLNSKDHWIAYLFAFTPKEIQQQGVTEASTH